MSSSVEHKNLFMWTSSMVQKAFFKRSSIDLVIVYVMKDGLYDKKFAFKLGKIPKIFFWTECPIRIFHKIEDPMSGLRNII